MLGRWQDPQTWFFVNTKRFVFVNGCFWHHHDCGRFVWPTTNVEYWRAKIERNVERDKQVVCLLNEQGWRVIIVWECELKENNADSTLQNLFNRITSK